MAAPGPTEAVTFAVALGAGVAGQLVAHALRIPAIVPLLATGVLLGPDLAGVIDPRSLGDGLFAIVELGVAVILFEGGMNLDLRRLRRQAGPIRLLVTFGALLTALGATLAARFAMDWPWTQSLLFGVLVIVTGPTVIGPLLRNIRVQPRVGSVLNSEGVLIDPVGAIVVAVVLQGLLAGDGDALGGIGGIAVRLAIGTGVGLAGGLLLRLALRSRHVPEELETLLALGGALVLFVLCDQLVSQTGILAVTLAGMVVGDAPAHSGRALRAFQGSLTLGLIGVLFVLLAADVRLAEVFALGGAGLATVALLVLVVRPLQVAICTAGSDLSARERAFLAGIAPRGVVAAAVASAVEIAMEQSGLAGGRELRALVFLTIAVTVLLHGATAGPLASALGVRLPERDGIAILGADGLALALAGALRDGGRRVVLLDANADHCHAAEQQGFQVVFGNALDERTLARARLEEAAAAIGCTANDEANSLFVQQASELFDVPERLVAVNGEGSHLTAELLERQKSRMLFDRPKDVARWSAWSRRGDVAVARFRFASPPANDADAQRTTASQPYAILALERRGAVVPMSADAAPARDDRAIVALHEPERDVALEALARLGWRPDDTGDAATA